MLRTSSTSLLVAIPPPPPLVLFVPSPVLPNQLVHNVVGRNDGI